MRGAEAIINRYLSSRVLAATLLLAGITLAGCGDSGDAKPPGKSEVSTDSEPQNKSETTKVDGVTYYDDGTASFYIRNRDISGSDGFDWIGATCIGRDLILANPSGYGTDIAPNKDSSACINDGKITVGELTDLGH